MRCILDGISVDAIDRNRCSIDSGAANINFSGDNVVPNGGFDPEYCFKEA